MFRIKQRIKNWIINQIETQLEIKLKTEVISDPSLPSYEILAEKYGHRKSINLQLPQSSNGNAIPWWTYPAIEYFSQLDIAGLKIFEYSSGSSSIYFANKGANVWCVEHNPDWFNKIKKQSAQLRSIVLEEEKNKYINAISATEEKFDIIIIDGIWRNECAAVALKYLYNDGLVILDNSDWYKDVAMYLRSQNFFQVDFNGFGPCNTYCWTTSFFLPFKSRFADRLLQPCPIGGIEVEKGEKW